MFALPVMTLVLALSDPTAALDKLLDADNRGTSPGCAVDVRRGDTILFRRGMGLANLEDDAAITPDSIFEAGSVSKQFVAAGLAYLQTQGRVSLDDAARRWLPELPAIYAPVTLRMMLNHTSGIRSWNNLAELTGRGEDMSGYDNAWVIAAVARQHATNNAAGTEYLYSNSNYVLAATIIERVSGKRLNAFFREALFGPLGMTATQWRDDFPEVVKGRAQAYSRGADDKWRLDVPLNDVVGAGGLLTTVGDLQRWNAALDRPSARDRQWVTMLTTPGRLADGTTLHYGLGLELAPVAGQPAVSHAGSTAAYRAWLGRVPAARLSVAVLCNDGSLNTEDLGPAIVALYVPPTAVKPPASATINAAPLPNLAGKYRNLLNDALVEVTVDGAGVRFNGSGPFVETAGGALVSEQGDRAARLDRDARGTVVGIALGRAGNVAVPLRRTTGWTPAPTELALFAGTYHSADVDGTHRIRLDNAGLTWVDPAGNGQPIAPIYPDGFAAPESAWTLRFLRDPKGHVTGFDASITRARRIHFQRFHG